MIKHNMEKHTINWVKMKFEKGDLNFSISIQRKEVWDIVNKSNLICSILLGVPIESVLFEEEKEGDGYKVIDGKQRCTTILHFINDKFAISEDVKIPEIEGVNIVGMTFSQLPESLQYSIREYELPISVVRPLSESERKILFALRNSGVSITKLESANATMGEAIMDTVHKFMEHPFMNKVNLTETALKRNVDEEIVLQCLILETNKEFGFSNKELLEFTKILGVEGITKELEEQVIRIFDYLNKAIPEFDKNLRKNHISMLYMTAKKAIEIGVDEVSFGEWVVLFFKHIKKPNKYSNSNKNQLEYIKERLIYMRNHMEENANIA